MLFRSNVARLRVCLALSGRALELLQGFGLLGIFAAFDASPFLPSATPALAPCHRHGRAQGQLFHFFVLFALSLAAGLALVQGVFEAHLVQEGAVRMHAAHALYLVGASLVNKRVDGVQVGAPITPGGPDRAASSSAATTPAFC